MVCPDRYGWQRVKFLMSKDEGKARAKLFRPGGLQPAMPDPASEVGGVDE